MKLNPDCIRDILLGCEEACTATSGAVFHYDSPFEIDGRAYQRDELLYHLNQCKLNEYFVEAHREIMGTFYVKDLTPKAHEFLADVRDSTNWNKTKEAAKKAGVGSLSALRDIAAQVIAAAISAQFKG